MNTVLKFDAISKNVKLTGRSYYDGNIQWLVQSGAAAEFEITAVSSEVVLAGDGAENSSENHRPT